MLSRSDAIAVRPMRPEGRDCLVEMLQRCSRASRYHRFHGFSDGSAYIYQGLRSDVDVVRVAWAGPTCIGFGVLAENRDRPWELGILVEDAWQRQGVGTRLMLGLIREARCRQMSVVETTILCEDAYILGLLRRLGAVQCQFDRGTVTVAISLAPTQAGARPR